MPGVPSRMSRAIARVREQLKSGKTRGVNPRKLNANEFLALEQLADRLREKMSDARRQRLGVPTCGTGRDSRRVSTLSQNCHIFDSS